MEEDWVGSRYRHCPIKESSMKKLINDEMSRKPSSRKDGPSIVARLMGMDVPPLEAKLTTIKKPEEPIWTDSSNDEKNIRSSIVHRYSKSNSFQHEFDPIYDHPGSKPKRREHPQEEELQKFKKEFEAWQAARFKECSRFAETVNASTWAIKEKSIGPKSLLVKVKSAERRPSSNYGESLNIYAANQKEFNSSPSRARYQDNQKVPTKIVVLKPGPDRIWSSEGSWTSFSGSSEEKGSIEDFLEEVKERLKQEIQGKNIQKDLVVPRNRIASVVTEKPQDAQKIAKQISSRIRESVTRDLELGPGLVRSESTRSHRSDIQLNEISSPELISRDTRRFLAERLKNVLRREMDANIPIGVSSDFSRSCLLQEREVFQKKEEIVKIEEEQMHTSSFQDEHLIPKNLVRSLSAPVSGTSFGKLLLEDPHVITGAHIRRKHEHSIENLSAGTKKGKKAKERFNLREKVYNFRSTFALRGRLFRRRMASMADLHTWEPSFRKDIWSGPTVIFDPGERHENSTEVPPSPASVSSSNSQEELWRPSNDTSPISPPETTSGENMDATSLSGEITSTHNELQRQLSQSSKRAVEGTGEHASRESKLPELEDGLAAYVRALLDASGMYDGLSNTYASRSDTQARPISTSVYEEVEVAYQQHGKGEAHHGSVKDDSSKGIEIDHRVLYDLVNEALPKVLGQPAISSRFRKKVSVHCDLQHPCGPRLMDSLWGFISSLVYPPEDVSLHYSLDSMVAQDLRYAPWFQSLDEEVDVLGAEIEGSILRNLISEVVGDIKLV